VRRETLALVFSYVQDARQNERVARHGVAPRLTRVSRPAASSIVWELVYDGFVAKGATIQRIATPTAILVGLPEDLAAECTEALADGGLKVLLVGHVAAACERIPVVMPQVVVTTTSLTPHDADTLADRCVAVGAQVIKVAPEQDRRALGVLLKDAANMALIRALRRGG
jgi:hypothetical protein